MPTLNSDGRQHCHAKREGDDDESPPHEKSVYILPTAFGTAFKAFTSPRGTGNDMGTERTLFPGIVWSLTTWVFERERESESES